MQHRVPVHEALAAVDEPFLVQPHECLGYRRRESRIHREPVAAPVDAGAEAPHLPRDHAAGSLLPLPHARHECLAAEVVAGLARRVQLPLHHHLRRDAGVVGARLPQRRVTEHAVQTRQRVHDRVLERVAHVQGARHVRRRDNDRIGRTRCARREVAGGLPALVEARLDVLGCVGLVHRAQPGSLCVSGGCPRSR